MRNEIVIIICKEYNKYSDDLHFVTYVVKRNPTPHELWFFQLRHTYNQELVYYACKVLSDWTDEQIVKVAEGLKFKSPQFIRL